MIKTYVAPAADKAGTKILIDEDWCKGCGICIEFCPKRILLATGLEGKPIVTDPSLCTRCMLCEVRCPDFAIRVRSEDEDEDG